jgi:hypothetical protein
MPTRVNIQTVLSAAGEEPTPLVAVLGQDDTYEGTVTDKDGNTVNLTAAGVGLTMAILAYPAAPTMVHALSTTAGTITGQANGDYLATLGRAEKVAAGLRPGEYYYTLSLTGTGESADLVARGPLYVV